MYVEDFVYDGISLSEMGYMVCTFDGDGGVTTAANGAEINFSTTSMNHGEENKLIVSEYSDTATTTFSICKNNCDDEIYMTVYDVLELTNWLNRKTFNKLKFLNLNEDDFDLNFNASFNVNRVESSGKIIGLELTMITDAPYGFADDVSSIIQLDGSNSRMVNVRSDGEGRIYPKTIITVNADGDLKITNNFNGRLTKILGCKKGEVITMDNPIIESSLTSHHIADVFNWEFVSLENKYNYSANSITASLPCKIQFLYTPKVKITV